MDVGETAADFRSTVDVRHVAMADHAGHAAGLNHAGHAMFDCAGNPVGHGRGACERMDVWMYGCVDVWMTVMRSLQCGCGHSPHTLSGLSDMLVFGGITM